MKIIHVTDLHLGPRDAVKFGASQHERLAVCIADINDAHADAELCVVTGDLADRGDRDAYKDLRALLKTLAIPYRLLLGNHDRRAEFLSIFPDAPRAPDGFVQGVHDAAGARLMFLDTLAEGRDGGALDEDRLRWIEARLAEAAGRPVLIFMHHPPLAIGIPLLDPIALADPGPFLALLQARRPIPHLFFGHVHRSVHGSVAGAPFSAQRGLSVQFALDLKGIPSAADGAPPSYGIILVEEGRVVVHEAAFLAGWSRFDLATGEHARGERCGL